MYVLLRVSVVLMNTDGQYSLFNCSRIDLGQSDRRSKRVVDFLHLKFNEVNKLDLWNGTLPLTVLWEEMLINLSNTFQSYFCECGEW